MFDLYIIRAIGLDAVKVGKSTNVKNRFSQIQSSSPISMSLVAKLVNLGELEDVFHSYLQEAHIKGEWFRESHYCTQRLIKASSQRWRVEKLAAEHVGCEMALIRIHRERASKKWFAS